MSATKQLLEEAHQQEFFTDDSYEDFLSMQREHLNGIEFEKINEELLDQKNTKIEIDWTKQSADFLSQSKTNINDLPF